MVLGKSFIVAFMASLVCVATAASGAGTSKANSSLKPAASTPAPEFGPSVVFDRSDAPVQLADLRGKMVAVVFFQSWCPICNGWSPDMLKQVTTKFGDDPSVALVAIKVDGGTPAEAKAYLKGHGADLSKWIVASDNGGLYYQRVSGTNALWGYALIDDQGRLIERGKAGSAYVEPTGKRYVLADPEKKKKAITGEASFVIDQDTPAELMPIARAAQAGRLVQAVRAIKSYEHGKSKDAAAKLRAALVEALSSRAEKAAADLKSDDADSRYQAYHTLQSFSTLTDLPAGLTAKTTLASLRTDKAFMADMANQARAESAYWMTLTKSVRLELKQRKEQLPAALRQLAGSFAGTAYAQRAMNEAETISAGSLVE